MQYASVVRILAFLMLILVAGCGVGAAVAIVYNETGPLASFAVTALFLSVAAVSVLLLTPKPTEPARPRDGLAVLILFWVLAPLVTAPVFMLAEPDIRFADALLESASNLTTTGYDALYRGGGEWPVSLIVWRAVLHILGAWASLIAVASIFAAINLGGPGIHRTVLFTIPEGSFFDAIPRVVIAAGSTLLAMIVTLFLLLAIAGSPLQLAMTDAISVATTGLVYPGRAEIGTSSDVEGIILFLGLVFSTIGLAVALEVRAGRWRQALRDPELITLLILLGAVIVLCGFLGERVVDAAGWAMSEFSTSGIPVTASGIEKRLPLPVVLLPVIIGGSALSTAGGVKLARISILMARAGQEFRNLSFKRSVAVFSFRGRVQPEKAIIAVWVYLVAYILAIAVFMIVFSVGGLGFEGASRTSVGALSNAGNLIALTDGPGAQIQAIAASVAMVLGRLEVLAVLPAFVPGFWRS